MTRYAILSSGVAALLIAACSDGAPSPEQSASVDSTAAPAAMATSAAAPAPTQSSVPDATASSTPTPTPTPTPSPSASAKPAPTPSPSATIAAAVAPAAFARCAVCHDAVKGGADKLGPNLYGSYGTKAGQGGFAYSDALKGSGLTWDEATLHKWLENPRALVPGNRMSFPGLKDAAKRQEIIDYLKKQR